MFQAAYDSAWHHPGVAWLGAAALLVFLVLFAARARSLRGFFVVFALSIALDAYTSGPLAPKAITSAPAFATVLSIVFVILGDYRYFVLVESFASGREPRGASFGPLGAWLSAIPFAVIVPIASLVVRTIVPGPFVDLRKTFLLYEVMFLVLALVMRWIVAPRRLAGAPVRARAWLLRLTSFEIVQYALWALADVIILAGHSEPGYLLRFVPNVLYYGLFLFFAWRTAPRELSGGA